MSDRKSSGFAAAVLLACLISPASNAETPAPATADNADLKSMFQASMLNMELARLASSRASRSEIKDYASTVITDQKSANAQLSMMADRKQLTLSCELDNQGQTLVNALQKKTGRQFDNVYVKEALASESRWSDLLKKQTQTMQNTDMSGFAHRYQPISDHHLELLQALNNQVAGQ